MLRFTLICVAGRVHIGNYFGAVRPWVRAQHEAKTFISIVDLHSLTSSVSPAELRKGTLQMAATLLAAGLGTPGEPSTLTKQIPARSLSFSRAPCQRTRSSCGCSRASRRWVCHWLYPSILTCIGALRRMIQFKEKAKKGEEDASLGLLSYPVLQCADILLYRATHVRHCS